MSSIAQKALVSFVLFRLFVACVSGDYYKTEESGMDYNIKMKMNIRVCGIQWEKRRIKHTQMKGEQCTLLLRAWLCYFYITFTFIAQSYCLMAF